MLVKFDGKWRWFNYSFLILILLALTSRLEFWVTSYIVAGSSYYDEDESFLYIGNDFIEIVLDKRSNGGIYSIIDKASEQDFRRQKTVPCEIFNINVSPDIGFSQHSAATFSHFTSTSVDNLTLHLVWMHFPINLNVFVNITVVDNSPLTSWYLNIDNQEIDLHFTSIVFPTIWGLSKIGSSSEDDFLVIPRFGGLLINNPLENLEAITAVGHQHFYPSDMQMQFVSFYDSDVGGLYIATYDNEGYAKSFDVMPFTEGECWLTRISHLPIYKNGADFAMMYPVIIGVFNGDWYEAADLYKDWAYQQRWIRESQTKRTPEWLRRTSVWHTQWLSCFVFEEDRLDVILPFDEIPQIVSQDVEFFGKTTGQFFWGWERYGSGSWGNWLPPLEGWESFDDMIGGIHEAGSRVGVFLGFMRCNLSLPDWDRHAIELPGGNLLVEESHQSAIMCPATSFWKAKLKECCLELAQHGVDLIHFDETNWRVEPCINEDHGHARGYGKWWSESLCEFFAEVRKEARMINPEIAFSIEGICEVYIPFVDVFWHSENVFEVSLPTEIIDAGAQLIALFDYVYHRHFPLKSCSPIAVFNGHMSAEFADVNTYCLKVMAHPFIMNGGPAHYVSADDYPKDPWQNPAMTYLRKISNARFSYAYNFVVLGEPARSPKIEVPEIVLCPSSGYPYPTINLSAVLYNVWQASDDSLGLLLTNIWNRTITFNLNLNLSQYGLTEQNYAYCVRDGKYQQIGIVSNVFGSTFQIAPQEILLIAFSPGAESKPDLWISVDGYPFSYTELLANHTSSLNITIWNTGPAKSTAFNVSLSAFWEDRNQIVHFDSRRIEDLAPGDNMTLTFSFTPINSGNYFISFNVDADGEVTELDELNNQCNFSIECREHALPTDLNKDGTVNIMDIAIVAKAYGTTPEDPGWNPIADVAEPYGEIDIVDIATVAKDYGKKV